MTCTHLTCPALGFALEEGIVRIAFVVLVVPCLHVLFVASVGVFKVRTSLANQASESADLGRETGDEVVKAGDFSVQGGDARFICSLSCRLVVLFRL